MTDDRYWKQSNLNPDRRRRRMESLIPEDRTGCWLWTGSTTANGYGVMRAGKGKESSARWYVHRVAYETWVGPIPEGFQIDHLCRARACFRPDHLEAVPQRTNLIRGDHPNMVAHRTDRCRKGLHDLTGTNVLINEGRRRCRECYLTWVQARKVRRVRP